MRILDRYIRSSIIESTILVVLVLLGLEIFMEFISQLPDLGHANYHLGSAFFYVLTQLPSDLYQLFPMAGFLGCLLGLGRLASRNELIVMRASGVSVARMAGATIKAALLMIFIATVIGECIAPKLQALGKEHKTIALSQLTGFKALGGVWLRDAVSFIHIGSVNSKQTISDITRFVINRQHVLLSADYAAHGELVNGRWQLDHVISSEFHPNRVTQIKKNRELLDIVFDPVVLREGRQSVDQQSIAKLRRSIDYARSAGLETNQLAFVFWQRLFQPLTSLVMICLGVPFIFRSLRSATTGFRILTGVIIGFTFYMLNQCFSLFAMVYPLPPLWLALIPTMLFGLLCVILLRRFG